MALKYLLYTETFPSTMGATIRQTGIGRYCHDLATGLAARGQYVTVLTNAETAAEGRQDLGFQLRAFGRRPAHGFDVIRRAAAIRREVLRLSPDCVLIGDPDGHGVYAIARIGLKVPYCPIFYGTEVLALAQSRSGSARGFGSSVRRRVTVGYAETALERVCISRYTCGKLQELSPRLGSTFMLYPVVSKVVLTPPRQQRRSRGKPAGSAGDPLKVVTVGRISERKNQLRVLEILNSLRRSGNLRFHYTIVGNVDSPAHQPYMDRICRFVEEHGLEDSVSFAGGCTDQEKIDHTDAADVCIMLSQTVGNSVEGFGITAIESSCRGKPIIVSDEGGMPETVVPGTTGYSVRLEDDDEIRAAIMALANDPALRSRMGQAGAEYVRERFTPSVMGDLFHKHILSMLVL